MNLHEEDDYRRAVRHRIQELKPIKRELTLRSIAERIPMQYTYLSKALHDAKTHLNDDHLHALLGLLDFFPDEIDYLFLLRDRELAQSAARREFLSARIEGLRATRNLKAAEVQDFDSLKLTREMDYLFDPVAVLVNIALHVDEYRANPRRLCAALGLTPTQVDTTVRKLARLNQIELDERGGVAKLLRNRVHYSPDHPLLRAHQSLFHDFYRARAIATPEADKRCFQGTFTADAAAFTRIQEAFGRFITEVEAIALKSPSRAVFQMSFDFFKW